MFAPNNSPFIPKKLGAGLIVEVVSAKGLRLNGSHSGAADVFCTLQVDKGTKKKTSLVKRAPSPTWQEEVLIDAPPHSDQMHVSVRHSDILGLIHPVCGRGSIDLAGIHWASGEAQSVIVSLEPQGEVRLVLRRSDEVFGRSLSSICEDEVGNVPALVRLCCGAVEEFGLEREGLYRVPGSKVAVDQLAKKLQSGNKKPFAAKDVADIFNICSLLKQFLRELPEPILSATVQDGLLSGGKMAEGAEKDKVYFGLIDSLPEPNRSTVIYLLSHLSRVAMASGKNKMDPDNLATCFAPALLGGIANMPTPKTPEEALLAAAASKVQNGCICYFIKRPHILSNEGRSLPRKDPDGTYQSITSSHALSLQQPKGLALFNAHRSEDGGLSFESFRSVCFKLGLYVGHGDRAEYKKIDGDGSNNVKWPRFKRWWEKRGSSLELTTDRKHALHQLSAYFQHFDRTKSGTLSVDEFEELRMDLTCRSELPLNDKIPVCYDEGASKIQKQVSFMNFVQWVVENGNFAM